MWGTAGTTCAIGPPPHAVLHTSAISIRRLRIPGEPATGRSSRIDGPLAESAAAVCNAHVGKFIGQAEDTDVDDAVFEQLCALGSDEGESDDETCECVGTVAQELTSDAVREKFGNDRRQYETFITQHPQFAHVPHKGWIGHREPGYLEAITRFKQTIREFRMRTFDEHPMRHRPEPGHKRCNGTGKIVRKRVDAREGLFGHVSATIHDRGSVADLLRRDPPFALFFPAAAGSQPRSRMFRKPGGRSARRGRPRRARSSRAVAGPAMSSWSSRSSWPGRLASDDAPSS